MMQSNIPLIPVTLYAAIYPLDGWQELYRSDEAVVRDDVILPCVSVPVV